MVSTKDIVLVAVGASLYAGFLFLSGAFVATPGLQLLYFPIVWWYVFPVWWGGPGIASVFIGAFIGNALAKGLGILGIFEAIYMAGFATFFWLATPRGTAELKKLRDYAVPIVYGLVCGFVALILILGTLAYLGLFPWPLLWVVLVPTWAATQVALYIPTTLILLKGVTLALKRAGVYTGPYSEWREAKRTRSVTSPS